MDVQELRPGLWRWAAEHPQWNHAEQWGPEGGSVYAELPEGVEPIVVKGADWSEAMFFLTPHRALVTGDLLIGKGGGVELPVQWFPQAEQEWARTELKPMLRDRLGALPVELVL